MYAKEKERTFVYMKFDKLSKQTHTCTQVYHLSVLT